MRRSEALKIITRILKQPVEGVTAADLIYGRALAHIDDAQQGPQPWGMEVTALALRIVAQLPLEDDSPQSSPAQAEEAKRHHGLTGRTALITLALTELIPGADPDRMTVQVAERYPDAVDLKNTWSGTPLGLAEHIATAVWGSADGAVSPLAQAEDAKRRRDLEGEIGALMAGHDALTSASWYPARPGDLVHVHYEGLGATPAFGETYLVALGMSDGFLSMQLLAHTLPPDTEFLDGLVGCFAVDDDPEPLTELWMEAGSHRLTIVRDGRPVHLGAVR